MSRNKKSYTRKRLFVDPRVQGSLVRQLVTHWCLACFLVFLYLFTLQAFSDGFSMTFQENLMALWSDYGVMGMILAVISPVFIYDSIKLSNRFVGPMVSFRAALRQLAAGESPMPVRFRQNDFWKELSHDLNKVAAEMQTLRESNPAEPSDEHQELAETH